MEENVVKSDRKDSFLVEVGFLSKSGSGDYATYLTTSRLLDAQKKYIELVNEGKDLFKGTSQKTNMLHIVISKQSFDVVDEEYVDYEIIDGAYIYR